MEQRRGHHFARADLAIIHQPIAAFIEPVAGFRCARVEVCRSIVAVVGIVGPALRSRAMAGYERARAYAISIPIAIEIPGGLVACTVAVVFDGEDAGDRACVGDGGGEACQWAGRTSSPTYSGHGLDRR